MSREWRLYAGDIRDSCHKILTYIQGMNREQFLADSKTYDAVVRNIEIIGEAVKHLPASLRESDAQVRWDRVAAMRNILAHAYFGIDEDILWSVIERHIPALLDAIETILSDPRGN